MSDTQQTHTDDNGGNNGPHTHADTNSDEQHTMSADQPEPDTDATLDAADAHEDLLAATDQVAYPHVDTAPNWYADKVAHPLGTAEHRPALDPAEPQPHPDTHTATDRSSAELSPERVRELYRSIGSATVDIRDALHVLGDAFLDCAVAARQLAALVGQLPDVRDGEPGDDSGASGGPGEPAGGDGRAGGD